MQVYHHLTYAQRCQIFALKERNFSLREIAADIGVHFSTISRELRRNRGKQKYRHVQAQAFAKQRKSNNNPRKIHGSILEIILEKLALQWSPQQISGWLKRHNFLNISHELIYQYIWHDKHLKGRLYLQLRHSGKKYNKRSANRAGRGFIPGRVDIDQRPDIVEEKSRIGDWELDTIVGANHKGSIVSMVDRMSKFAMFVLRDGRTAAEVGDALVNRLKPMSKSVLTLTADNGKEFAGHAKVAKILQADFYFAKPYSSWQRGLNEHTNGLVRQYFPKKTDFHKIRIKDLQKVEDLINNRPRKILDFRTPKEVFFAETKEPPTVALQH